MPPVKLFAEVFKGIYPMTQGYVDLNTGVVDADLSAAVPGMIARRDVTTEQFALGVGNTVTMPFFLLNAATDKDVRNYDQDPAVTARTWVSVVPSAGPNGVLGGLAVSNPMEVFSTAVGTGTSAAAMDTPLTSPTSGGDKGKIIPGTRGTNTCIGLVSRPFNTNYDDVPVVALWTHLMLPTP